MIRTKRLYSLATLAWGLLVFGLTVLVFSGRAAPFLTPEQVPVGGPLGFVAVAATLLVAGALAISVLEKRAWQQTGRAVGLSPEGSSLFGKPDLVGTEDGRTVRARTIERDTGGGDESGSSTSTFTVVEAELDRAAEQGLVLGHGDGGDLVGLGDAPVDLQTTAVGDVAVVGDAPELAREVVTDRVEAALAGPSLADAVLAGNASDVLLAAVPEGDGGLSGRILDGIEARLEDAVPGEADAVRIETEGALLDAEELRAQVVAVAAVAEAFERATGQ